jgi:hypothetical protein
MRKQARKKVRRKQSQQDKKFYFQNLGDGISDPLKVYRELLWHDLSTTKPIPNNLISISSELILMLLTGKRIDSQSPKDH